MHPKNAYRSLAAGGTVTATALALAVANAGHVQRVVAGRVPVLRNLPAVSLSGAELGVALATTTAVVLAAFLPLCKPRPRRILDTITEALRSVLTAAFAVAALGYFDYTYRLPRATLVVVVCALGVALPVWFVALQRWQLGRAGGTLVIGTDPERVETAIEAATDPVAGYALASADRGGGVEGERERGGPERRVDTDGGRAATTAALSEYDRLGGLSRLDDTLERANVGTVVPAFPRTDRAEFFGVLATCHRHGVGVKILDEHGESVLLDGERTVGSGRDGRLVGLDLEPLDLQNRVCKRLFDVAFAGVGLLCSLPVVLLVGTAVKLDSRGPVFYAQERSTQFGDTFRVYKFRTMTPEGESAAPGEETDRVTRVGRVLRETHLDELPQLWAILRGRMSVVGPRPAWVAEERLLRNEVRTWQKRWFVKPGLTGLAQVRGRTSEDSEAKLRYDLAYIDRQSFRFDLKIVVRQFWQVLLDCVAYARDGSDD